MLKALVDSMDSTYARLLIGDEEVAVSIPVKELPPNTREGMLLGLKFMPGPVIKAEKEKK